MPRQTDGVSFIPMDHTFKSVGLFSKFTMDAASDFTYWEKFIFFSADTIAYLPKLWNVLDFGDKSDYNRT